MKLLFDGNLSPDLPHRLAELYPGSNHVEALGITSSDSAIWEHARANDFVIVSKDTDFQQRALIFGPPPRVILVRLGNCRTGVVESLLRQSYHEIEAFVDAAGESLLVLP